MKVHLNDPIMKVPGVGFIYQKRLEKLDIITVHDLLYHIPHRYEDYSLIKSINQLKINEPVTIRVRVSEFTSQFTRSKKNIQIAKATDESGEIETVWFNQHYLKTAFKEDKEYYFSGKLSFFGKKRVFMSPFYEEVKDNLPPMHTARIVPIYRETYGVKSKWLRTIINNTYNLIKDQFTDPLSTTLTSQYKLVGLNDAIKGVHFPTSINESAEAKRRLAFDELLMLHLENLHKKLDWKSRDVSHTLALENKDVFDFINSLPFTLTSSQEKVVGEILKDLKQSIPMNRLLEGDVGSGKTVVAAVACYASFLNGKQSVIMTPTQILATQHFYTLKTLFDERKVRISLVTSAGVKGDKGKIDIFVGTHALIHKNLDFDNVSLVVIDEQHKFGVEQRAHLTKKTKSGVVAPHILTMTATPIPRTIALTLYGDLDLSTLNELPSGRIPITTWVVPQKKRDGAYKWIEENIVNDDIQAFIICPLIEESEAETMKQVKSATQEFEKLKDVFSKLKLGLLHGKLKAKEKDKVIKEFRNGKTNVLVSTPVVEVGVDIPNATIMVIEAADRFGLAQLHQLRGRVGRGKKKSYCLLFPTTRSKVVNKRLSIMQSTMSGFKLAEEDLNLRGPGQIFGTRQHGFRELKIASWSDTDLIKTTKKVAEDIINKPRKYKMLISEITENISFN